MAFLDVFKKDKNPKSPTKAGQGAEGSISADVIPFLNIIAKNSLALPGMARDMNVLRQNIVKLVKLKNAEAITKADKFFKTEDQRESELEDARKKETSPQAATKEGKPKKEKMEKGGEEQGILGVLWDSIGKALLGLFLGLGLAFAKVFDLGKIISGIVDALNPMPLIEGLFKTLKEGWQKITESDIVKETLIKGFGKFLEFITAGLFGEKELRQSLDDLKTYITPMIDVLGETFDTVVAWLKDNVGWDSFTLPLSKAIPDFLPDWAKSKLSLPDITIPGFRPFKNLGKKEEKPTAAGGGSAPPAASTSSESAAKPSEMKDVSAKTSSLEMPTLPTGGDKTKSDILGDVFGAGSNDPSAMFSNMMALKEKYKDVPGGPAPEDKSGYASKYGTPSSVKTEEELPKAPTSVKEENAKNAVIVPEKKPEQLPAKPSKKFPDRSEADGTFTTKKGNQLPYITGWEGPNGDRYAGLDKNSGQHTYINGEKGEYYLSEDEPTKKGGKLSSVSSGGGNTPNNVSSGGSMGANLSGGSNSSSSGVSPSPSSSTSAPSGASLSSASSEVAEGQRMDSAANAGVYVDAGTVNNGSSTTGKPAKQTASAYNTDFIKSYSS